VFPAVSAPSNLDFGPQTTGHPGPVQLLEVKNSGGAPLVFSGAAQISPSGEFAIPAGDDQCNGQTVPVGQSCSIGVQFTAAHTGARSATLTLGASNLPNPPATIALTGIGVAPGTAPPVTTAAARGPSARITTPSNHATYTRGQRVLAAFGCADGAGGPGISSCRGTVPNGTAINTSKPGRHNFTVTATSADGKVATTTVSYTVVLPANRVSVRWRSHAHGTLIVTVEAPGPGRVDVLLTAWTDNFATHAAPLQPATGRFVFARGHATATHRGIIRIDVTPTHRGRQLVADHRYRVTLRLWVTYTPTGGQPRSIGQYGLHLP
jgi:hypothetical protein